MNLFILTYSKRERTWISSWLASLEVWVLEVNCPILDAMPRPLEEHTCCELLIGGCSRFAPDSASSCCFAKSAVGDILWNWDTVFEGIFSDGLIILCPDWLSSCPLGWGLSKSDERIVPLPTVYKNMLN